MERERNRFRLFVPKRYCIPTRTFLGVSDRFMAVSEPFRSFYDRFRSFVTFLRQSTGIRIMIKKTSINAKERHKTIENAQERWTV
jgi:hypothetical protein